MVFNIAALESLIAEAPLQIDYKGKNNAILFR